MTVVEQDQHHFYAMPLGNSEKFIDSFGKSLGIVMPNQIVQEYTDRIEAKLGRPPELTVNRGRIISLRLPHLQLVDGRAGDKVAADQPRLLLVPLFSLVDCPTFHFEFPRFLFKTTSARMLHWHDSPRIIN